MKAALFAARASGPWLALSLLLRAAPSLAQQAPIVAPPEPAAPLEQPEPPLVVQGLAVGAQGPATPLPPERPAVVPMRVNPLLVRLGAEQVERPVARAPRVPSVMRNALWLVPNDTIVGALLSTPGATLGYQRRLREGVWLLLQGRLFGCVGSRCGGSSPVVVGGVTLGLVLNVSSPQRNQGFFLQPLVRVESQLATNGFSTNNTDIALGVGLGVGYQLTAGNFFVAPQLAISHNILVDPTGSRPVRYSPGFDFGGIRLGVAFGADGGASGDGVLHPSSYRNAVWTTPLWTALGPVLDRFNVNLGANFSVADHTSMVLDASVEWGQPPNGGITQQLSSRSVNATAVRVATGPMFSFARRRGLNGFFIGPRLELLLHLTRPTGLSTSTTIPGSFVPLVGAEMGYQATLGHLYLAGVVGANIGFPIYFGPGGTDPVVFNISLVGLRLGYAL